MSDERLYIETAVQLLKEANGFLHSVSLSMTVKATNNVRCKGRPLPTSHRGGELLSYCDMLSSITKAIENMRDNDDLFD